MIAVVTSTLAPANNVYSFFSVEERYQQTLKTIQSLLDVGFKTIYLFDNSKEHFNYGQLLLIFPKSLFIFHQQQFAFKNKGINEALLLLNNLHHLPEDEPIFKISGRYFVTENFDIYENSKRLQAFDLIGRGYDFNSKIGLFSTRGYFVKNKRIFEDLLVKVVEEIHTYPTRIHGLKSGLNAIKTVFTSFVGSPYQISMEQAFARVIKKKYSFHLLNQLHIAGFVAGSSSLEKIQE